MGSLLLELPLISPYYYTLDRIDPPTHPYGGIGQYTHKTINII